MKEMDWVRLFKIEIIWNKVRSDEIPQILCQSIRGKRN